MTCAERGYHTCSLRPLPSANNITGEVGKNATSISHPKMGSGTRFTLHASRNPGGPYEVNASAIRGSAHIDRSSCRQPAEGRLDGRLSCLYAEHLPLQKHGDVTI